MGTLETLRDMVIEEFELDSDKVQPDTDLKELGVDSLEIIEFMFKLEDKFKVVLPDQRMDAKTIRTLRDIASELDALMAAQPGKSSSLSSTA